jgi:GT2 family glycosyltransferase
MENDVIVLNTDDMSAPSTDGTLWGNRLSAYSRYDAPDVPLCSIIVCGYNRLEKTKTAVECILKYTQEIDYELILIDHGSTDCTLDYFKSVNFEKKRLVHITKNIASGLDWSYIFQLAKGKYIININNDVYITQNWLLNLLACLESDEKIGLVMPMSSNVSNLQQNDLGAWDNMEQMQQKAAFFNVSDPSKWKERLRLITVIVVLRRDVLDTVGRGDPAYTHDFGEDDLCVRLRRMGYKLILCKDTWVCHDHDFRNMEDKNPATFQASLESGRAIYREKYHGIDPWDDINNYELKLLAPIDTWTMPRGEINALCVDVRCGTPVLEIRNHLRERGRTDVKSRAFTTQAKYFLDLQTTGAETECDRIDFIQSHYADETFDIVVLGEPLNCYPTPITLLQRLYNFLKRGGLLLFKLRNTNDFNALMRSAGLGGGNDDDYPAILSADEVSEVLKLFGGKNIDIESEQYNLSQNDFKTIENWLGKLNPGFNEQTLYKLTTRDYTFSVGKG